MENTESQKQVEHLRLLIKDTERIVARTKAVVSDLQVLLDHHPKPEDPHQQPEA